MNTITTILELGASKHCFLERTATHHHVSKQQQSGSGEILVYELKTGENRTAFFSTTGKCGELISGDTVQLNGLYAEKLGLKHGDPLMLKRIKSPLSSGRRVNVEPLSPDDWEILEQNSGRVETVLLDQVRVVWPDQIFPIWIQRSICVFMKITSVEPMSYCLLLENNTEIVVSPKTRLYNPPKSLGISGMPNMQHYSGFGSQNRSQPSRTPTLSKQPATATPTMVKPWFQEDQKSSSHENLDTLEPRPCVRSPSRSPRTSLKKISNKKRSSFSDTLWEDPAKAAPPPPRPMLRRESSLMESVVKYVFRFMERGDDFDSHSESDTSSGIDFSSQNLPSRNGVLRVQPMKLSKSIDEWAPFLSSSLSSVKGRSSYMSRNTYDHKVIEKTNPVMPYELFQPSTIYVDADSTKIERELHPFLPRLPNNFIARLQRLPSPQEKAEAAQKATKKPKDPQDKNVPVTINNPTSSSKLSDDKSSDTKHEQELDTKIDASCFVRVVVIDRKAGLTDEAWKDAADMLLTEQPLMIGHVIIPDLLRRQLKLDATGSVWLQTGTIEIIIPKKVVVYPLTTLPVRYTNDMLEKAFRAYIKLCADADHPLILFQGLFIKFAVFPEFSVEVQVTFFGENDLVSATAVTMLSEQNIDSVLVNVERNSKMDKMGVVNNTLVYSKAHDFDTQPPPVKLKHLGGIEKVAKIGLAFLQVCVGSRPLSRDTFRPRRGLSHGSLLITGPRGSGKSSLAKALCRKMHHIPTMAHITLVDCKALRGKTVAHIQKILESVFDEAAWREPAIIVFDNLDVIMPASSGPEGEMNAEALYAAKNSQVFQGLIKYEIENNSCLAVIATAASKNSLHPSLVSHSGVHYFQLTLNIGSPNKEVREKMLTCMLQQHSSVSNETLKTVDLSQIASKTEGYVARDLEVLVNRALHDRLSRQRNFEDTKMTLTQNDFDLAQEGFKPVSIRGIALHKAGDLGWADIGGLDDIKRALVETLQWPAKYSRLFSSSPLRQRSGTLLYGAPGTGKTLLAGVVAKECGLNFISIKGPELLSKYIGASEQAVRDIFTRATSAKPCILFFDEFDSIAPKRGHDSTGVTDRVVNQFLTQLDGVEGLSGVYVLAATSRPDLIDSALLRPGRLDKCLQCTIPTERERYYILEALTKKMCLGYDVDLVQIAQMCHFFTGADIKALLYNAQLKAIHENARKEPELDDTILRIKGDDEHCPAINQATQLFKEDFQQKLSQLREKTPSEKNSPTVDVVGDRKASGTSEESTSSEVTAENKFSYSMSQDVPEKLMKDLNNVRVNCDGINSAAGVIGGDVQLEGECLQMEGECLQMEGECLQMEGECLLVSHESSQTCCAPGEVNSLPVEGKTLPMDSKEIMFEPLAAETRNVLTRAITHSVGFDVGERMWPPQAEEDEEGYDYDDEVMSPVSDESKSSSSGRSNSWIPLTSSPLLSPKTGNLTEDMSPISPRGPSKAERENFNEMKFWKQGETNQAVPSLLINNLVNVDDDEEEEDDGDDEKTLLHKMNNGKIKVSSSMNLPDPSLTYPPHTKRKRSFERAQSIPAPSIDATDSKSTLSVEKPVMVFTSLERGLATLSPEDEARYLEMVVEIQRRDDRLFEAANAKRRTSFMIGKGASNILTEVCQCHLVEAAREMRPSVSVTERRKYDSIYTKFVSSRRGDGARDKVDSPEQKRATLA